MPAFAEDNAESSAGSDAGKISSMLVYGDSLATGYRLENYSRFDNSGPADSFPNLLCKNYALEYDKNFFNYAKTGEDSTKTLAAVKNTSPEPQRRSKKCCVWTESAKRRSSRKMQPQRK